MRGFFVANACAALLLAGCAKSHPPHVAGEPIFLVPCGEEGQCAGGGCPNGICAPAHVQQSDDGHAARSWAQVDAGPLPPAPRDAGRAIGRPHSDGCVPGSDGGCGPSDLGPLLRELSAGAAAWRELTDGSAAYWYEELNCTYAGARAATLVQVENDVARIVATRTARVDECGYFVNRDLAFTPHTMDELLGACEDLVRREGRQVGVVRDARGVLYSCVWPGANDCSDACGEGFALLRWAFGRAPQPAQASSARDGGAR